MDSNSSLTGDSVLKVNGESTFTLGPNATLTVGPEAMVDFSAIKTDTVPQAGAEPIKINGIITLTEGAVFKGPVPPSTPEDAAKFVAFGENGGVLVNYGTTFYMGEMQIVGDADATASYTWASDDDGAQIEINGSGLTIRDIGGGTTGSKTDALVAVSGPGAYILKEQTLTLDTGVKLVVTGQQIWFVGDANGGAQLKGQGELVVKNSGTLLTTIIGGPGWQVVGTDTIGIGQSTTTTGIVAGSTTGSSFKARGTGAIIRQETNTNTLSIGANVTVDLGGSTGSPGGIIVLKGDKATGGTLTVAANGKVLLGTGTGGQALTELKTNKSIGGIAIATTLAATDYQVITGTNFLVQIGSGSSSSGGNIVAMNENGPTVDSATTAANVIIASNMPFTTSD
jgi:hypothetical protein